MTNKKWLLALLMLLPAMIFVACDDEVSYSEMKEREREAIEDFIVSNGIKKIKRAAFEAADSVTDIAKNEYVLLGDVYAQFVCNPKEQPGAKKVEDGTGLNLLVRFVEYSIMDQDTINTNRGEGYTLDEMRVENESGSFKAYFTKGEMYSKYGSPAVPEGWLTVMPYLYFARSQANLAEVNLIVPHTAGTSLAATYVYPCFYNITFQMEN